MVSPLFSAFFQRRTATVLPFAACFALVVALLPFGEDLNWVEISIALGLQLIVGVGLLFADRFRAPGVGVVGIVLYLASVALLRDGTTPTAGFGPLVLLPVMWAAVRGRRLELAVAVAGIAVVYVAPYLLVGPPTYTFGGLRAGALMVTAATSLGLSIVTLVGRLRDETELSAAIQAAMSEGYALTRDDEIIAVNPALCALTGLTERQLVGSRPPYPFSPPELVDELEDLCEHVIAADGGEFQLTLMHADGRRFPAQVTATRTDLRDGSVAFLNTVRDITSWRDHEDAQRRHTEQLAAIAEVTRAVSHSDPLDARRTIRQVALDICEGAHIATIWEPAADGTLAPTAGDPQIVLAWCDQALADVFATGRPAFVAHAASVLAGSGQAATAMAASVHFEPITGAGGVRGVLSIAWPEHRDALSAELQPLLGVLAQEAALAMERADLLARMDELTRTDDLTGLPNRRAWDEILTRELAAADARRERLSVAMLDLDFFKAYNDEHGHLAGDRLLRRAAAVWQGRLRSADVLARWGGEEFALLLPGCDGPSATALIERLRGSLPETTFSAGIACWDGEGSARVLVDAADQALYAAKSRGRDRVVLASGARGPVPRSAPR